jgi:hypothetical protein
MVTAMFGELDPDLAQAFVQARAPLAADEFTANLLRKIERARRTRLWRQILAILAVVVFLSLNMRLVLEKTASVVRFVGDFSPTYSELLVTPWGWAVSMLIGIWVVLRTRPSRR